jgi:hypothetical protein
MGGQQSLNTALVSQIIVDTTPIEQGADDLCALQKCRRGDEWPSNI